MNEHAPLATSHLPAAQLAGIVASDVQSESILHPLAAPLAVLVAEWTLTVSAPTLSEAPLEAPVAALLPPVPLDELSTPVGVDEQATNIEDTQVMATSRWLRTTTT